LDHWRHRFGGLHNHPVLIPKGDSYRSKPIAEITSLEHTDVSRRESDLVHPRLGIRLVF